LRTDTSDTDPRRVEIAGMVSQGAGDEGDTMTPSVQFRVIEHGPFWSRVSDAVWQ
jgi:hypothetical protein